MTVVEFCGGPLDGDVLELPRIPEEIRMYLPVGGKSGYTPYEAMVRVGDAGVSSRRTGLYRRCIHAFPSGKWPYVWKGER